MAVISGVFHAADGLPKDGATVKLWASSRFVSAPQKDTALPSGDPSQSTTTGTSHGGNGAYRFTGVTTGTWYVSVSWNGSIVYDSFDVVAAPFTDVTDYGAVGDGVTNDTTAIGNAIADTAIGVIFFPPGTYLVTGITVNGKTGLIFEGQNATIKLSGTGSSGNPVALTLSGSCRDITIRNLRFLGGGTASDYHTGIEVVQSTDLEGIRIQGCHFETLSCGIWMNATIGTWRQVWIESCEFEDIIGTGTSQGRGIFVTTSNSEPIGLVIRNCDFDDTDLHGVHLESCVGARVDGCVFRNHRSATANGSTMPALYVQECYEVTLSGNHFYDCSDSCIGVIPAGNTIKRIQILDNVIENPLETVAPIRVGSATPASDGTVENLLIRGNQVRMSGLNANALLVYTALHAIIQGNIFQVEGISSGTHGCMQLVGEGDDPGTSTYSDDIIVAGNVFTGTESGGALVGIRLPADFCTSNIRARFDGNYVPSSVDMWSIASALANDSVIVTNQQDTGLSWNSTSNALELDQYGTELNAWLRLSGTTASADATLKPSQSCCFVTTGASDRTITLPAISSLTSEALGQAGNRSMVCVVKVDSGAGRVIVSAGADTILGLSSLVLPVQYSSCLLVADSAASDWHVIGQIGAGRVHAWKSIATGDSPYTVIDSDEVITADTSGGNIEIDLPTVVARNGRRLRIYRPSASNTLTLDPDGTEQIDGGGAGTAVTLAAAAGNFWDYQVASGEWKRVGGRF